MVHYGLLMIQSDKKKQELLKNPTKFEEIQEKKFIDRNVLHALQNATLSHSAEHATHTG